jgi:hypothetical protein
LVPPSGLTVVVAPSPSPAEDFDTDDKFWWDGYDNGAEYSSTPTVNHSVLPYTPSCSHVSVPLAPPSVPFLPKPPRMSAALQILLKSLFKSPVVPRLRHGRLAVTDTGATEIPDKSCFISYKFISGLSVRMGNNSFVPVLGRGTAVFTLNGKRVLVRNVLHVPGLAVPLYSLQTHATQQGCGFMGAEESGFLVYFPDFVLSVDTAVDSHLSFDPLSRLAPLSTLHYVQPHSPPATYPYASLPALSHSPLHCLRWPLLPLLRTMMQIAPTVTPLLLRLLCHLLVRPSLICLPLSKTWQSLLNVCPQLHPNQLQSRPLLLPLKVSLPPTLLLPSVRLASLSFSLP